jgi:hypothetical protein
MSYVAKFGFVSKDEFEAWFNTANPPIEDDEGERVFSEAEWEDIATELEGRMSNAFDEILGSVLTDIWMDI